MITTFFSWKGGSGRTTAVANCALELAREGAKVLIVDFDLQAPGVHRFFGLTDADTHKRGKLGVVDLTHAYVDSVSTGKEGAFPGLKEEHLLAPMWTNLTTVTGETVTKAAVERFALDPTDGEKRWLKLLPAGRLDEGYAAKEEALDWGALYEQEAFRAYVAWLRARLSKLADIVLIDARAGATDVGSVCSAALADRIVLVTPPTHQGFDGVLSFARRCAKARADRAEGRCLLLASRVSREADARHLKLWRDHVRAKVAENVDLWLPGRGREGDARLAAVREMVERFEIPETPQHAVGEPLLRVRMLEVGTQRDTLLEAYEPLLGVLREGVPQQPLKALEVRVWQERVDAAVEKGAVERLPSLYVSLCWALFNRAEELRSAPELATRLADTALKGIAVSELRRDMAALGNLYDARARALAWLGREEEAEALFRQALEWEENTGDWHGAVVVALQLSRLTGARSMVVAREWADRALRIGHEHASDQPKLSYWALAELALLAHNAEEHGVAMMHLAEADTLAPGADPEDLLFRGWMRRLWGRVRRESGDLSGAELDFVAALTAYRAAEHPNHEELGLTLGGLALVKRRSGEEPAASLLFAETVREFLLHERPDFPLVGQEVNELPPGPHPPAVQALLQDALALAQEKQAPAELIAALEAHLRD
ncbi:MAG: AAA family ATPase [Pseudomonadota bacterium]|nr:AAA family ATPase [Pseudomonadota bacterium]